MAISDIGAGIQELDEILDGLMGALGIPDKDDPSTRDRKPTVPPGVVSAIGRLDELVDEMQAHLGIKDVDKAALLARVEGLSGADLTRILEVTRSQPTCV